MLPHYHVHSKRERACLHHQVVALDLAGMQSRHQLVGLGHSKRKKTGVSTLQRGGGSHSGQQVCLSRHVSAVGHVRYATMPASPGGNAKTQQVCK